MLDLRGRFAPLVTPFTDDSSGVSEIRLARLMRKLKDQGVAGYVVCSQAGEFTCLSFSERKDALEIAMRESQGLPVIAHVSTLSTTYSLDLAQHAKRHGARAAILIPPYYPACTQDEIEWHFRSVAQYSELPIIAIDPMNMTDAKTREALEEVARLQFAKPGSRTEAFQIGDAVCDVPSGLPIELSPEAAQELSALAAEYGPAKILKAALFELEIEVGPLRKPLQNLDVEIFRRVERLVSA